MNPIKDLLSSFYCVIMFSFFLFLKYINMYRDKSSVKLTAVSEDRLTVETMRLLKWNVDGSFPDEDEEEEVGIRWLTARK